MTPPVTVPGQAIALPSTYRRTTEPKFDKPGENFSSCRLDLARAPVSRRRGMIAERNLWPAKSLSGWNGRLRWTMLSS